MALWVAVALISMIGLGANVCKYQTGEPLEWASTIAEIACLLAAVLFIFDYIRKKRAQKEEQK